MNPSQRFNRRSVLRAAGLTAAGLVAAACSGTETGSGTNTGSGASGSQTLTSKPRSNGATSAPSEAYRQVEGNLPDQYKGREHVVFWAAYESTFRESLGKIADGFNKSQDEVYLDLQYKTNYDDIKAGLTRGIQNKTVPDVFWLGEPAWRTFAYDDVLEPLDGYFGPSMGKDSFVPSMFEDGVERDQTWWISFNRSTPLFYYNRDAFEQAGLPDRGPKTWSELQSWIAPAKGVKVSGQDSKLHCFDGAIAPYTFPEAAWVWNGAVSEGLKVTVNEGGALEAGTWLHDFVFKSGGSYLAKDVKAEFYSGRALSIVTTTAQLAAVLKTANFPVGVGQMPAEKTATPSVPAGGGGFSILSKVPGARKKAAFKFVEYANSPEVAAQWYIDTGYLPVITAAIDTERYKEFLKSSPATQVTIDQMQYGRSYDEVLDAVPGAHDELIKSVETLYGQASADPGNVLDTLAGQLTKLTDGVRDKIEKWKSAG